MRRGLAALLALCLAVGEARAEAPRVLVAPYLQGLTKDGVAIRFELGSAAAATVSVGVPGKPARSVASPAAAMHVVQLGKLEPATHYTYEVRAAGASIGGGAFTTAPADARPFSFLVYGDTRTDPLAHAAVVRGVNGAPGDFLINTGDLTQRGGAEPGEWLEFFGVERKLLADRCAFVVVGNHELAGDPQTGALTFLKYFATGRAAGKPHLYDSFRWGNTRFFLLDAMDDWGGPERAWLADALTAADAEPGLEHRFAVAHAGPWSSGPHDGNRAMRAAGIPELLAAHHVDLVISGHDHLYERGEVGGVKYLVSGGGGAPTYQVGTRLPTTQAVESVHHWAEIAVDGPRVSMTARRVDGSVIERCGYAAGAPWTCDAPAAASSAPAAVLSARAAAVAPAAPPAGATRAPAPFAARGCAASPLAEGGGATAVLVALAALLRRRARR